MLPTSDARLTRIWRAGQALRRIRVHAGAAQGCGLRVLLHTLKRFFVSILRTWHYYFFSSTPRRACGCVHAAHGEIHVPPSTSAHHCGCLRGSHRGAQKGQCVSAFSTTASALCEIDRNISTCRVPPVVPPCVRRIPERAAIVHVVMHSQLRWRARAHSADTDGRTSGCDV